jgi:hypothetical protein
MIQFFIFLELRQNLFFLNQLEFVENYINKCIKNRTVSIFDRFC